jgi:hypothetical protein
MPSGNNNRRKHTRLPLQFRAEFQLQDSRILTGKTKNISFGGVFIYCRNAAEEVVGSEGKLRIILQDYTEGGSVTISGRIVRVDEEGMGIQFVSIGFEDYQKFRNMMLYNNPSPDVLLKELKQSPGIEIS